MEGRAGTWGEEQVHGGRGRHMGEGQMVHGGRGMYVPHTCNAISCVWQTLQ